jgi:hypothetical protein
VSQDDSSTGSPCPAGYRMTEGECKPLLVIEDEQAVDTGCSASDTATSSGALLLTSALCLLIVLTGRRRRQNLAISGGTGP